VTALELAGFGVRVERTRRGPRVLAPKGRADLAEVLRAEVARRVPHLRDEGIVALPEVPRVGTCETCGDPLANGRGGMCDLCIVARHKAPVQLGRIPA